MVLELSVCLHYKKYRVKIDVCYKKKSKTNKIKKDKQKISNIQ